MNLGWQLRVGNHNRGLHSGSPTQVWTDSSPLLVQSWIKEHIARQVPSHLQSHGAARGRLPFQLWRKKSLNPCFKNPFAYTVE